MQIRTVAGLGLLAAVSTLFVQQSISQPTFEERYRQSRAANPDDLEFSLLAAGHRFHPGEIIRLTLQFSSTSPNKYLLNGATYDRSGRLPTEEFVLDRTDVPDPLSDYFGSGVMGGLGGGLRSQPVLGPEPHRIEIALNDWFRFEKPGKYRLFLKSHRLSRERRSGESGDGLLNCAPVSNIVEIEVTEPDSAWETTKLRELETALDDAEHRAENIVAPVPGVPKNFLATLGRPFDPKARQAAIELRYLGTRDAVRLMLKQASRNDGDVGLLGLIGSAQRAFVIAELDRYVQDPDTIVTASMIRLRTLLDFVTRYREPLPAHSWEIANRDWKPIQKEAEKRQKDFEDMLKARAKALITLPYRKSGSVREQCVDMLVELAPEEARAAGLIPPDDFGLTREQLIAQFESLTESQKLDLLSRKWDLVNSAEMIPVLRRIIERAPAGERPNTSVGFTLWHGPVDLGEEAVQRLLQLAPDEAKRLLFEEIMKPRPRFAYLMVNQLTAQGISKADTEFAAEFNQKPAGTIPLVAKFGTGALADQVRAAYQKGHWPCEEETWFLAYFLRTRPSEGKEALARALANREQRGCHRFLFGELAYIMWTKDVEQQALASLYDPDPETALDAARALAARGSADVESHLWKRLEIWNEKWRARRSELNSNPITGNDASNGDQRLGVALFEAIGTAQAWFLDRERANRLAALCLNDGCRKKWSAEPSPRALVEVANGSPIYGPLYKVAQYMLSTMDELKAKMIQFPSDTMFSWCPPRAVESIRFVHTG